MKKDRLDELYHLLREVFNEGDKASSTEITDAIYGLAGHLLAGKDYLRLIQYSAYYGRTYLLEPTFKAISEAGWQPARIVEFGAGLGWLSRGLASKFKIADVFTIDKRIWVATSLVANLETTDGITAVIHQMKDGDLIVMSDFLHCVTNPKEILETFDQWPIAILEYMPVDQDYASSWEYQLKRYGGNPIDPGDLSKMLSSLGRHTDIKDLEPYVLILIGKEQ